MHLLPLSAAEQILPLHPLFEPALKWLHSTNLQDLAVGQHPIDGDLLFVNVEVGTGNNPKDRRFESHRKYIDWQVNVSGGARMRHCLSTNLPISEDLLQDNDLAFHSEPRQFSDLYVPPDWLAVYYPEDAHMPSLQLAADDQQSYRKVVVKILLNPPTE